MKLVVCCLLVTLVATSSALNLEKNLRNSKHHLKHPSHSHHLKSGASSGDEKNKKIIDAQVDKISAAGSSGVNPQDFSLGQSASAEFGGHTFHCPPVHKETIPSMEGYYMKSLKASGNGAGGNGWVFTEKTVHDMTDWMNLKPGQILLDVGCGNGEYARMMSQQTGGEGLHIIGVDPMLFYIDSANQRDDIKGGLFCVGKAQDIKFIPDNSVDQYVSVFPHAQMNDEDSKKAVLEAFRVTKPGGNILIASVNDQDSDDKQRAEIKDRGQFSRERAFYEKIAKDEGYPKPEIVTTLPDLSRGIKRFDVHWRKASGGSSGGDSDDDQSGAGVVSGAGGSSGDEN